MVVDQGLLRGYLQHITEHPDLLNEVFVKAKESLLQHIAETAPHEAKKREHLYLQLSTLSEVKIAITELHWQLDEEYNK